jgi:NAD(P)-dependent dehydrogenase (short-subunit alcohol dehydrogenase family)
MLLSASAPRAVAVGLMASLGPVDDQLVAAMTAGNEAAGLDRAEVLAGEPETGGPLMYGSTKEAIAQWIRRNAPKPEWAGTSIPLNAAAPGIVRTPMTAKHREQEVQGSHPGLGADAAERHRRADRGGPPARLAGQRGEQPPVRQVEASTS